MNPTPLLRHFFLAETLHHDPFESKNYFNPVQEAVEAVLYASSRVDSLASKT